MSNMDQHIDKILRERLQQHDSGAPMHLWSGIITERKTRRGFFFWLNGKTLLIGLALLTALAVAGVFWLTPTEQGPEEATQLPENPSTNRALLPASVETTLPETAAAEEATLPTIAEPAENAGQAANLPPVGREDELLEKGMSEMYLEAVATTIRQEEGAVASAGQQVESATDDDAVANTMIRNEGAVVDFLPTSAMEAISDGEADLQPGKCVSFADPNWSTYFDVYFSPDYALRSLSARNPAYTEYAKLRSEETFQFAFTTGLRYNVVSPRGFGIRVGLQYAQIGELFSHVDPDAIEEYIVNNYDPVDGSLISSDTTYVYGTAIKEIHNYYRMIDVPVMLGYEWEFDRVKVSAYGGMIANLWFGKKGQFFAPDQEQIVEFTDNSDQPYLAFKDHLSAHVAGSFSLQYQFSPKTYLLLEPHFRIFPRGITREDYVLNQSYFVSGVAFGLRFKL
jgi:hypothetical protein